MPKLKILIVEDDRDIAKLLAYNLEKEGHQPLTARDGEEGVAMFRREKPRLVILDLMLPKVDGLEVCRMIRADDKKIPVLMLTAKSTEVDKIVGLEMGADDYVTKLFSVREVMTRVKTLLRRTSGEAPSEGPLAAGALELDPAQYELRLNGKPLEVTGREFELIKILWAARGKVLSREEILERVWGIDKSADIDTRTVDQHVARLRSKLGPEKKRLKTVKSVGYRFISE
jgi:DNA-binding response OmpR family regulator